MKKEPNCKNGEKNHVYHDRVIESDDGEVTQIHEICAICKVIRVAGHDGTDMGSYEYFRTFYDPKTDDDEFTHERQECREGGSVHLWDPDWEYFCVPTEGAISKVMDKKCERCDVVRRECVFRGGKGSSITYSKTQKSRNGLITVR